MRALRKLIRKIGIWRKYLLLLLLRSPFDALMTWLCANLMKSVFGCLEANHTDELFKHCVIYGLLCAALFVYNGMIWMKYAAFSAKAEILLQRKMLEKMLSMRLQQIDSRFSGEWMTRLNSDIRAVFTMMNGPFHMPHLIIAFINVTFSCYFMQKSSLLFLGITWIFAIPPFMINDKIVLKAIPKIKEDTQTAMADNTSAIRPLLTDTDAILLYDARELIIRNCTETSRKLMKNNLKIHLRKAGSNAGMQLFGIGGYLMLLFAGFEFIYHGRMAFSDIVYCFQVRGGILSGMLMLMTCLNNLKTNAVCVNRILETLEK